MSKIWTRCRRPSWSPDARMRASMMASPNRCGADSALRSVCRDTLTATGRTKWPQKCCSARKTAPKVLPACPAPAADAKDYFAIKVVDDETGRGVPLVELRTVNALRYYTDSNGLVAFREPGLMDTDVFFSVASHGYEYSADGFGFRGG